MNIHDQTQHIGKVPKRCPHGADQQTQLIRLRREMKEAVAGGELRTGFAAARRDSSTEAESQIAGAHAG